MFFFKILHIPKLLRTDLETWFATKPLNHLHTLIIFKVRLPSRELIEWKRKMLPTAHY